jgi:disulfide bond formation protein DsbB
MLPIINITLSTLTFIGQISLLFVLTYLVIANKDALKMSSKILSSENAIKISFAIALLSTMGSLFYSEIAKFPPCDLCWFQRIFMYPQVVLLGIALIKKDNKIVDYSLALAGIGILISLYHNYIVFAALQSPTCSLSGVSCTTKMVLGLGYVTIPLMALTAFALIITTLVLHKFNTKQIN